MARYSAFWLSGATVKTSQDALVEVPDVEILENFLVVGGCLPPVLVEEVLVAELLLVARVLELVGRRALALAVPEAMRLDAPLYGSLGRHRERAGAIGRGPPRLSPGEARFGADHALGAVAELPQAQLAPRRRVAVSHSQHLSHATLEDHARLYQRSFPAADHRLLVLGLRARPRLDLLVQHAGHDLAEALLFHSNPS